MTMDENRSHWETVHAKKQDSVSWHQEYPETSLELVLDGNPPKDAAIIDIGGGASRLVDCLRDKGFTDLTVLDIADSGMARARQRLGERASQVNWLVADITQWQPGREYDVWHDRAVFHFLVSADARDAYRRALRAGLKPGGRIIIGTFAEDGPEQCSGLSVQRYSADALTEEIGDGFERVDEHRELHRTPAGREQSFQFVVFRRR